MPLRNSICLRAMVLMSAIALCGVAGAQTYTESVLVNFTGVSGAVPGAYPLEASLIQASDGYFYGTTTHYSGNGYGTVFKMTPSGVFTLLHSFSDATTDGERPYGGLVQGTDGNFYGTTASGGVNGYGTVFQISSSGAFKSLHSFGGGDGKYPGNSMVQGTDGNFYGITAEGGVSDDGTVFKITPSGAFTLLHSFSDAATDGKTPGAGLVQGTDGNFYGTTIEGGARGNGTVFEITPDGTTFVLLHSFVGGATDGESPYAGLVQGTDGNFYGNTFQGGTDIAGTVFKMTPRGVVTLLHSFLASTDGEHPESALVQGTDGNFYGTTTLGGASDYGTVFQITPGGDFTLLHTFPKATTDGGSPGSPFVEGADGNFYGDTVQGGTDGYGTVFKLAVSPALSAPVQLTIPAGINAGSTFTLSYLVTNATSDSMQQCFATNTAGDTSWTGLKTGATTFGEATLTASSTSGIYTYALTCGGMESGFAYLRIGDVKASSIVGLTVGSPVALGDMDTLTATPTTLQPIAPITGSVTFSYGGASRGSIPLSNGSASLSVTAQGFPKGTYPVTATYSGDTNYLGSSVTTNVVVKGYATAATVGAMPTTLTQGQSSTLSSIVSRTSASGTPTGTVKFYAGAVELGSAELSGGTASLVGATSGSTPPGKYAVTAKYSGDSLDQPATSAPTEVTVLAATGTTVIATPNPVPGTAH
jgi:uncharacterized repeat protein (TIGR03803 family)